MARIRSIHPGIFTDERFMVLSSDARTLLFGIWCHSWDDGVFEWKPVQLKVKVFPYNSVDLDALLSELQDNNIIKSFEVGERKYGAVRNFRKFQRPKKPNSSGVLPSELETYVGLLSTSSAPVGNQSVKVSAEGRKGGREEGRNTHPEGKPTEVIDYSTGEVLKC